MTGDNGLQVVVVTGASSGIGRATAVAFAERHAGVVLAARDGRALDDVAAECELRGGRALAVPTDVSDEAAVRHLARRAAERFGRIDVWVNGAAVIAYGEFEQTPAAVFRQVLETNLLGQIHGARAVLPYFRENGTGVLVNLASVWGSVTSPFVSPYVVSKFGVRAFSETLQQALLADRGARDIHVCTILPQSVDTPIFRHAANYTGRRVKPVPPVVDPQRVVRAIVRSVDHPRLQRTVGWWGRSLEVAHALAPSLFARLVPVAMKLTALGRQPAEPSPGNVFEPMPEWNRTQGNWRNTPLRIGLAAAVTVSGAAVVRARVRRR